MRSCSFIVHFVFSNLLLLVGSAHSADESRKQDALDVARGVAAKQFEKCTYGDHDKDKTKVNCVQFVIAVVGEMAPKDKLTAELKQRIAINTLKKDDVLESLVDSNDDRTKGVAWALTQAKLGVAVAPKDAAPGDFVQYWYKDSNGKWQGHSGMVEKIEDGKATIYGAHMTTLQRDKDKPKEQRPGGVGSGPQFDLKDAKRKVYLVRWTGDAK